MGSIDETVSKRFRVRAMKPDGTRPTLGIFDTRDDAEAFLDAVDALAAGSVGYTVASWGTKWLDMRELAKAVRNAEGDRGLFRKHIEKDAIGDISLKALNRGHVVAWMHRVRAKGARSTASNAMTVLRGMLRSACDHGYMKANPATDVRLPREARTQEPWTWVKPEEQPQFLQGMPRPLVYLMMFAIGTGMRAGEIAALELADVHADHVVVRYGKPGEPTKNGKIRRVPLFGMGLEAWRAWSKALPAYCKENPLGLAFPRPGGTHRDEHHMVAYATWKKWVETAKLGRHVRFHDLRHTCASCLVSGSWGRIWTLEEVGAMLGHGSVSITQRYAHLAESVLVRAAKATANGVQNGHFVAMAEKARMRKPRKSSELTVGLGPTTAGLQIRRTAEELREYAEANGPARPRHPFRGGMVLQ